ncbi:ABC transporter substrate-binding protein [Scatolibacter rhodanostii]|uniref:ABC transporter substrate-binding protein n=1 Tax=Scatolibacter rhodanostii TaxID=2014781 RepID=UPI000C088B5E|nr:ABC transporter substrate-binding protein [Scatolibacter rhodanostii]
MKKMIALFLSAILFITLMSGCTTKKDNGSSENLREVNVVLDWYPNALHAFIYTAIERGYYKDEGLDVKIQFPANENDALSLVSAGKAEIGLYYQHDIIQAVANQDVGVKSIGAVVQSPLNIILSLSDKNIQKPADLVGKTVGYAGTALSEALVQAMMEASGEDFSSVNMVNVGFELMSSMTTGNVDATIGCLVNHEVPQMEEEGFDINYFMVNEYGIPNYYEAVFLAGNEMIENEPDVLAGFLRASAKGFADFQKDTKSSLQILLDNQNEENFPLSPSVEEKSSQTLLPLMETANASFLSQTDENWQANIDWMYDTGLIKNKIDVSQVTAKIDF